VLLVHSGMPGSHLAVQLPLSFPLILSFGTLYTHAVHRQGARSVRRAGLDALFVFIAPPSLEDLARRLVGRGTETREQVERRLANAKAEIDRFVCLRLALHAVCWRLSGIVAGHR
jgi:ribose 1,5-bisphosphokinase PhnN